MKIGIETSALLAELSISMWTARKLDRTVSQELVVSKKAGNSGAVRANKHLLAGRKELEVVVTAAGAARTYFLANTLPWSDSGQRLLPSARFMQVSQELSNLGAEFNKKVDEFVQAYPTLITAQAMALGDMFKREEFPPASEIRQRFRYDVSFFPVPTAGDFRVDIGTDAHDELTRQLTETADKRVERAMQDAWERLREQCTRLVERLGVDIVEGEEKPRIFRDSLVSSTFELVDLLRAFNVTNDPALERARAKLEAAVSGKTAELLREDLHTREKLQQQAQDILKSLSW